MKFTFKTETFGFGSPRTTYEFECDHLDDVLHNFKKFLRGAGYEIGMNDELELVDRSWEFNNTNYQPEYHNDEFLNFGDGNIIVDPYVAGGGTYEFNTDNFPPVSETVTITPTKKKGKK